MAHASLTNNDAGIMAAADEVVKSGFEPKETQAKLVLAIANIQYNAKNYTAANEQLKRYEALGGNMAEARTLQSRASYLGKDYAGAKTQLAQIIADAEKAGKAPSQEDLKLLLSAAHESKDTAVYEATVQKMMTYYPSDEYVNELIRVSVIRKPGFSQDNYMPVLRLIFASTKVMREEDYVDLAETALRDGFPTEAKNVLDAGYSAGVLGKGANAKAHNALRSRPTRALPTMRKTSPPAKPRRPRPRAAPAWSTSVGPTRRWASTTRAWASSSRVSPRAA